MNGMLAMASSRIAGWHFGFGCYGVTDLLLTARCSDAISITTAWYVIYLMVSIEKDHAVDVYQTIICIRSLFVISSFSVCTILHYCPQLLSIKYKY
jgi:hypothetical protein